MTRRIWIAAVVVVLAAIAGVVLASRSDDRVGACDAVTSEQLGRVLHFSTVGEESRAEGHTGATVCHYRSDVLRSVQVFEQHRSPSDMFASQTKSSTRRTVIDGNGYRAAVYDGPLSNPYEALFLLAHHHYVNVILRGFPKGAAARLAPVIADELP